MDEMRLRKNTLKEQAEALRRDSLSAFSEAVTVVRLLRQMQELQDPQRPRKYIRFYCIEQTWG